MILNQFPHSSGASEDSIHVAESLNGPWTHGRMLESEPTTASSCHAEGRRGAGAQAVARQHRDPRPPHRSLEPDLDA